MLEVATAINATLLLLAGQTLQDFAGLSEEQWASVEVVVKLGGGGSSIAAAKWQQQEQHKQLSRCNSSSVSLTLPLEVNMNTPLY